MCSCTRERGSRSGGNNPGTASAMMVTSKATKNEPPAAAPAKAAAEPSESSGPPECEGGKWSGPALTWFAGDEAGEGESGGDVRLRRSSVARRREGDGAASAARASALRCGSTDAARG